jgi:hypothetical protein
MRNALRSYAAILISIVFSLLTIPSLSGKNSNLINSKSISLQERPVPKKPANIKLAAGLLSYPIIVKFKEGSEVRLRNNKLMTKDSHIDESISNLLAPYENGQIKRLFSKAENELKRYKYRYESSSAHEMADLNLYYKIEIKGNGEAEDIINQLNQMDVVEIAYPAPSLELAGDIDPPTPDYKSFQDYLATAPGGIDALYSDTLPGGDGTNVKIIDIELNWNTTHEDLEQLSGAAIVAGFGNTDHGTAVAGIMAASDNNYGMTGICHAADIGLISVSSISLSEALIIAVDSLERGDIILIELQAPGPHYNFQSRSDQLGYVCMEYWQDIFDLIRYAWVKGIIVVEAAGNGAENFDDPLLYDQLFDTTYRNSHAILVGAGAPPSGAYGTDRSRLSFSNYGTRVNLQGHGNGVHSTGYGDIFNGNGDLNQYYTGEFGGTSAASPIIVGALACLQGRYKELYNVPLAADIARNILVATGSPQQENMLQHIGPRPNLAAAIPALPPPSLYIDPIFFDTTLAANEILNLPLWIYNRSPYFAIDYSINGNDSSMSMEIDNWLDVTPSSGIIPALDSILLTVTIDATIIPAGFDPYKGQIEISWNQFGMPLDSVEIIPVFLNVTCLPDTLFSIKSSKESGGPSYNWIDITSVGYLIPKAAYYNKFTQLWILDDGTAGPFTFRFNFPFYDSSYNACYVGINGAISLTDTNVNIVGYFDGVDIPGHPFQTIIAPFWNDLTIEDHGNIYYYVNPRNDTAIFEWYRVGNFYSATDTLTTFEIIITKYGDITFQYESVGVTHLADSATIGVGAHDCLGTSYFDYGIPPENNVSNLEAILFDQRLTKMAGDCNYSGNINLLDVSYIINYRYKGGPAPIPMQSGDTNCDDKVNLSDVSYIINYLYRSGPDPCSFTF